MLEHDFHLLSDLDLMFGSGMILSLSSRVSLVVRTLPPGVPLGIAPVPPPQSLDTSSWLPRMSAAPAPDAWRLLAELSSLEK